MDNLVKLGFPWTVQKDTMLRHRHCVMNKHRELIADCYDEEIADFIVRAGNRFGKMVETSAKEEKK